MPDHASEASFHPATTQEFPAIAGVSVERTEAWTAGPAARGGCADIQAGPATPSDSAAPALARFRVLRVLGTGAMGTVYEAQAVGSRLPVAVKVLAGHLARDTTLVKRFQREARVLTRLRHPNLVQGYEVGEDQGRPYLAMELVEGASLQTWLERLGRLDVPQALHIVLACARALEYLHAQGLVHRDIKPDNILISHEGLVKMADLGLVKALEEDFALTRTGTSLGTPWLMPLEQIRNAKDADGRCDIYALGCMLYYMLTGEYPFAGKTFLELIAAKERGKFPEARRLNQDVPKRLDLITAKMTAKLPAHRYADCGACLKDLQSLGLASARLRLGIAPAEPALAESTIQRSAPRAPREDRRTHFRHVFAPDERPAATLEVPGQQSFAVQLVDLSLGGLGMRIPAKAATLQAKQTVAVQLALPTADADSRFLCRVVYCQSDEEHVRIGLRFITPADPANRAALKRFLAGLLSPEARQR